jgi:hypothetical protein
MALELGKCGRGKIRALLGLESLSIHLGRLHPPLTLWSSDLDEDG